MKKHSVFGRVAAWTYGLILLVFGLFSSIGTVLGPTGYLRFLPLYLVTLVCGLMVWPVTAKLFSEKILRRKSTHELRVVAGFLPIVTLGVILAVAVLFESTSPSQPQTSAEMQVQKAPAVLPSNTLPVPAPQPLTTSPQEQKTEIPKSSDKMLKLADELDELKMQYDSLLNEVINTENRDQRKRLQFELETTTKEIFDVLDEIEVITQEKITELENYQGINKEKFTEIAASMRKTSAEGEALKPLFLCQNKMVEVIPLEIEFNMNNGMLMRGQKWKDGTELRGFVTLERGSETGQNVNYYYSNGLEGLIYEKKNVDSRGNIVNVDTFILKDLVFQPTRYTTTDHIQELRVVSARFSKCELSSI